MDLSDVIDPNAIRDGNKTFEDYLKWLADSEGGSKINSLVILAVYIPVFLVAFIGNFIILFVILKDPRMRKSSANYFLVNLAITDLLVAVICIPMTAVNYVYNVWVLGTTACKITSYMQGVCIVASILTILLMSCDRFFAIRHPMRNRQIFTVNRVRRLILLTWVTAAVVVIPIACVSEVITVEYSKMNYCTETWPTHVMRQVYDISLVVGIYLVPGVALVVLYTLMGVRLWARDTNLQRQNSLNNQDDVLLARRRLALMMIIVSVLFATSWLPYHIINICIDFEMNASDQLILTYPFAILLGHSKSAQNPILYCFMHKAFKMFMLRLIKCQCPKLKMRKRRPLHLSFSRSENSSTRSQSYKMIGQRLLQIECPDLPRHKGEASL